MNRAGIRIHYTPEHCHLSMVWLPFSLYFGGKTKPHVSMVASLYFGVEKATCFKWQGEMDISFKEPFQRFGPEKCINLPAAFPSDSTEILRFQKWKWLRRIQKTGIFQNGLPTIGKWKHGYQDRWATLSFNFDCHTQMAREPNAPTRFSETNWTCGLWYGLESFQDLDPQHGRLVFAC